MHWRDFYAALEKGTLPTVMLFSGPEDLIKHEALAALKKRILPEALYDFNLTVLEGADAQTIAEAANTLPMLCEKRMLVVRNWAPILPGKSKNEEAEAARMLDFLSAPPDTCQIIFFMRKEPDARKKLPLFFKKKGWDVRFDPLTDAEIGKWIQKRLRAVQKMMAQDAVGSLILYAGRDLTALMGELEKLIAYSGDRAQITAPDVEKIVSKSEEYTVFAMIDMLFAGKTADAYRSVATLLQSGQTRVGILSMLTRQLRMLTHLSLALESGDPARVERDLKIHPYAARRMRAQLRFVDRTILQEIYLQSVDADFQIKSGQMRDDAALDRILLKISDLSRK